MQSKNGRWVMVRYHRSKRVAEMSRFELETSHDGIIEKARIVEVTITERRKIL